MRKWCGKFLVANILAWIVFIIVGYFYYYGVILVPFGRLIRMDEGATLLRLDANGLNNKYYLDTKRALSDVDVLAMGSSHVFAQQIPGELTFVYRLNEKFANKNTDLKSVYSCGVNAYSLRKIIPRFELALERFSPRKYVVLELGAMPRIENIELGFATEKPTVYGEPPGTASLYWIKVRFKQMCKTISRPSWLSRDNVVVEEKTKEYEAEVWTRLVRNFLKASKEHNVTPILWFHSNAAVGRNGEYLPSWDVEKLAAFRAICEREGIVFVDATERFREEYEKNNVWPYGFCNAGIISGHLNRDGHRMVADVLEEAIRKLEAEKEAETTSATQNSEAVKTVVEAGEESEAKQ